jgi:hypothetical protein
MNVTSAEITAKYFSAHGRDFVRLTVVILPPEDLQGSFGFSAIGSGIERTRKGRCQRRPKKRVKTHARKIEFRKLIQR